VKKLQNKKKVGLNQVQTKVKKL